MLLFSETIINSDKFTYYIRIISNSYGFQNIDLQCVMNELSL